MTYAQAQAALLALGQSLSISTLGGRSLSSLLTEILVGGNPPTNLCEGSTFDEALRVALGITP